MAFREFTFPEVFDRLSLKLSQAELFPESLPPFAVTPEFLARLQRDAQLALEINTEKARSEFIIAPLLAEVWRAARGPLALFSGVEFEVDKARELNGYCDFLFSRSTIQSVVTPPVVAVVEAKNDNLRSGYGQCIATMVAAWEWNQRAPDPAPVIWGVVTTGAAWKFLRLVGADVTLGRGELAYLEVERILSILAHILAAPAA